MDAAVALRAQLKEQWSQAGIPVPTITDLVDPGGRAGPA